jgi:hypothetical protein
MKPGRERVCPQLHGRGEPTDQSQAHDARPFCLSECHALRSSEPTEGTTALKGRFLHKVLIISKLCPQMPPLLFRSVSCGLRQGFQRLASFLLSR